MKAKKFLVGYPNVNHRETGAAAREMLRGRGVKQVFVARHMQIDPAVLSQMLAGKRIWNARKAELFLEALK
jgi:hypothetical protein